MKISLILTLGSANGFKVGVLGWVYVFAN